MCYEEYWRCEKCGREFKAIDGQMIKCESVAIAYFEAEELAKKEGRPKPTPQYCPPPEDENGNVLEYVKVIDGQDRRKGHSCPYCEL
jgi:ribosomal protein L37AE/L43A